MSLTFIDTNALPKSLAGAGQGSFTEILNDALVGAKNIVATLRWLAPGDSLAASNDATHFQLIYLMDGDATISLDGKATASKKGGGVYVGPNESASIAQAGTGTTKVFRLSCRR